MKKTVNIIPLGQNCMPRTILTRYGLKKRKIFFEPTYPFDLAVFETREITQEIKHDFKNFFDNLYFDTTKQIWTKLPNLIEFTHETAYKELDKNKIINKYKNRIENFRLAVKSETPVIFVQILGDCSDIENLFAELKKIRQNRPFKFIVVDTQNITSPVDGIDILKNKIPSDKYKENWWKKEFYNSAEGRNFESKIADFVREISEKIE